MSQYTLNQLGWQGTFQQQISLEELETCLFARVFEHHRTHYLIQTESLDMPLEIRPNMPTMTVGDWLVMSEHHEFVRLLERSTVLSRKAAGSKVEEQLIAANVDTLFIVNSLNDDFNLNRIERYLAIAHESGCEPVIVLTKADQCKDLDEYRSQVNSIDPFLMVETVNALDTDSVVSLSPWLTLGKTVAFVGSSGVGKSTLVNTLLQQQTQDTAGIREDDSKGRHTTTARSLHIMPTGALLLDTPGVRELQIADCEAGVEETFSDIVALTKQCRFSDCKHITEPHCAVINALENESLDQRRLDNYYKLLKEQERNGASIAETRLKDKSFGKLIKSVQNASRSFKGK